MYLEHSDITTPADSTVIWRYMSIEKYLSLLVTKQLFLCRTDKFEDPWEAVWPRSQLQRFLESKIREGNESQEEAKKFLVEQNRSCVFAHCWHANKVESAAMWDLYSSRKSGIAIRTTVGAMKRAIEDDPDEVLIGQVNYIDYDDDTFTIPWMTLAPAFLKRKSFAHEHEVRVVKRHYPIGGLNALGIREIDFSKVRTNMSLVVDLGWLLSSVYFSPVMDKWLVDSLIDVSKKYGVDERVFKQSELYDSFVI